MVKINWLPIRQEYIESDVTMETLAEKYGVNGSALRRRASKEAWTTQREEFRRKVQVERERQRVEEMAKDLVDFDERALHIAKAGLAQVARNIASAGQTAIPPGRLEALSNSARRFQEVGRLALGASTNRTDGKSEVSGPNGGPVAVSWVDLLSAAEGD